MGAIFIIVKDVGSLSVWGQGEFLVFLSIIFFAWRNISRRWHSKLLNDMEITVLMLFFGVIMLILYSLFISEGIPSAIFNWYWSGIILLGGLLSYLILFFTNYGFAKVEAVLAGNISALEIVFGVIFGLILYRELPSIIELTGGLLVVISIVGLSNGGNNKKL